MSDLRQPAWVERVPASLDGAPTTRLLVVLKARGCAYARRPGGGCTMCGFDAMTAAAPVSSEELVAQLEAALGPPAALDDVGLVDLYNSGSFFADQELSPAVRAELLARLARTPARRVLVESRPEHLRADVLREARALLGERQLEVGIGLESADARVREQLIRKGFDLADFERAVATLAGAGARLLAYVLLKPQGLSEREAIDDAVATSRYVFEVAAARAVPARVALQPAFVPAGTALEREFLAGRYQPPSLWSAVEVVRRAHALGELQVGLSDEGLASARLARGCARCDGPLRAALAAYNRTRALAALDVPACGCA